MRILGLDVGEHTIGVAVSDALGWTAQGVTVIRRQNLQADLNALALVNEYEVGKFVGTALDGLMESYGLEARKFARLRRVGR